MYDVYFDTMNPPTTRVATGQMITSLARPELVINTTYYWKVVANDGHNSSVTSPVWQFTIGDVTTPIAGEERTFPLGTSGQSIVMCWIPAGSFQMGSPSSEARRFADEGPVHTVTFASGFWMGKYEVTQQQWQAVMGSNPARNFGVGNNYPVYNVSWNAIQTFESTLGNAFNLPSEAQWEYACRAGTTTRFYWGDDDAIFSAIRDYAWYDVNSWSTTHAVGVLRANNWGLCDMNGNVEEWCEDWYGSYSGSVTNPTGPASGSNRVLRGGSWTDNPAYCRSAHRFSQIPVGGYYDIGFRLVRRP